MQRPTADIIRADCKRIATVAELSDSLVRIAARLADTDTPLSTQQVTRRVAAMERDLGLEPAAPSCRGAGRPRRDGSERTYNRADQRRAGAVARRWLRFCGEGDCL
ncbi:hypothetical protein OV079_23840 [Nannocystis pusilla]|uniref:Uncharacterized protein n=1 Tax=Nannocystis pusilla TaxID=889268 RepID=A0A9X3ENR9_9BACT|nr:hypothetical protein [Nannocystis pusilla]MCY1004011.1 hypothetical protein [Nannocystis pusilla]MCY1008535.1 hypothetical protein [Nannocystis pusilla]